MPGRLFFSSIEPFRKQDALLVMRFPGDMYDMKLRPFWIAGDLVILYEWLNKPDTMQNAGLKRGQKLLLGYYRRMLESDSAQPLMLTSGDLESCHFYIQSAQAEQWYGTSTPLAFDCSIYFVLPLTKQADIVFVNGLKMLVSFFFSSGNTGSLFIEIPDFLTDLSLFVTQAGFQQLEKITRNSDILNLYVLTPGLFNKGFNL